MSPAPTLAVPLAVTLLGVLGIVGALAILALVVGAAFVTYHLRQLRRELGQLWAMFRWVVRLFDHGPATPSGGGPVVEGGDERVIGRATSVAAADPLDPGRSGLVDQRRPPP